MLDPQYVLNLKNACERLQSCSKKAQKSQIIREISGYPVWHGIALLLSPLVVSGVKEKSLRKPLPADTEPEKQLLNDYERLDDVLAWLSRQYGVTNSILRALQVLISGLPDELQHFAESYLCKTARLGVTAKSVNEALDRAEIPLLTCMLANRYSDHAASVEGKSFAVTEKLDGIRAIALYTPLKHVRICSRQGQLIEGLTEIEADIRAMAERLEAETGHCDGFVLDGELLIAQRDRFESKEQYKQTTKIVRRDGEKHGVVYHVFDYVPYLNFVFSRSEIPYKERRKFLQETLFHGDHYDHLTLVPILYQGDDTSVILHLLADERDKDHEGVMINLLDAPYRFGRTNDLLKVKIMQDCDLRITGMEEGSGKYAGTLGSLVVDYKGRPLHVGSGFTQEERHMFWRDPQHYIGRIITVQYFEETQDAAGNPSLRFPVFLRLREEGKEVSYT